MLVVRLCLSIFALVVALVLVAYLWACVASAQNLVERNPRPGVERALASRRGDVELNVRMETRRRSTR